VCAARTSWVEAGAEVAFDARLRFLPLSRYPSLMASTLDRDKLHDALDDAVVVIDEQELEESRQDPRVHELFARSDALLAELDAERANF
jgi:hypothetical protein